MSTEHTNTDVDQVIGQHDELIDTKIQIKVSELPEKMGFDETPDWRVTLTPVQRLGASLSFTILALVFIVTILIGVQMYHAMPLPPDMTGPDAKDRLDNYIALQHVIMDEATKTYNLFVTTSLLPLLTGLIGMLAATHVRPK